MAAVTTRYDDGDVAEVDIPPMPTVARRELTAVAVVTALVFGWSSRGYGYFFDEAYFVVAGRDHLSWGYFDQPPLIPTIAGLADTVAPGSLVVLRLAATLAVVIGTVMCGLIAAELGGGRGAQTLAAIAYATSLFQMLAHWLQTSSVDPALWSVVLWLLVRWTRQRTAGRADDRLLLWAGLVTAVSMQTKFLIPALWGAVLLCAAAVGPRDLLRRKQLWMGAAVVALTAVPTLIWQARHGWPYLQMSSIVAAESDRGAAVLIGMIAGTAIIGLPLAIVGLVAFFRAEALHPYRYLGGAVLLVGLEIVALHGRTHYAMGVYALLIGAGAVVITRAWVHRPMLRAFGQVFLVAVTAVSVVSAVMRLPIVSPDTVARWPGWVTSLGSPAMLAEGDRSTDDLRRVARRTYDVLPPEIRERTALVVQIYPMAAAYDLDAGRTGTVRAYSFHRGYYFFGAPPERMTDMMYIGVDDPDPKLANAFRQSNRLEMVHTADEEESHVYRYFGRTMPWHLLWDEWRTYK